MTNMIVDRFEFYLYVCAFVQKISFPLKGMELTRAEDKAPLASTCV